MTAPDRIWIAPTHRSNGVDDFYLLDPEFRGNRGTEYVRADVVDELVQTLEAVERCEHETERGNPHYREIEVEAIHAARAALARYRGGA